MEIYHRQGQHTKFTAVRCDDTQDAQKVSKILINYHKVFR